ncbi:MAG: hypothetical protein Q7T20_08225 [Saprospiraceae bacterium]|nr:hypothetical protein [Saprospiraceae bacterium]
MQYTRLQMCRLGIRILCWLLLLPGARAFTDTIPDLTQLTRDGDWLRLPSGKVIWVEMHDSTGESDEAEVDTLGLESAARRDNPLSCVTPAFAGVVRKHAKTIPHHGIAKNFATLDEFIAWLPADTYMAQHQPPIDRSPESQRIKEERYNVQINRAWLLSAYRERDNDFHLVLSNRPKYDPEALLFSVEVSGLPDQSKVSSRRYRYLQSAREQIISRLGDLRCGSTYIFREAGIPIRVKGSLFFDIHHAGHIHGRQGLNPPSAWEIHPVTKIMWLD